LRVTPAPADHAILISHGPYRIIRHPMYTSLFLLAATLVIAEFSIIRMIAALIMAADLWFKMNYEEKLLLEKFPGYKNYILKSRKILPYIY
jgi:protein-S-isoprenylcysteine O-methyltransferase Ste14